MSNGTLAAAQHILRIRKVSTRMHPLADENVKPEQNDMPLSGHARLAAAVRLPAAEHGRGGGPRAAHGAAVARETNAHPGEEYMNL